MAFLAEPYYPPTFGRAFEPLAAPPKLPSLEGLLKRIHGDDARMPSLRSLLRPELLPAWDESSQSDAASDYMDSPSKASVPKARSRASKYCKVDGCERVSQRNNLCHSHGGKRLCKEHGCASKDRGNGFCIKHGGGKICSIGGCDKKARRKGLCTQHFRVCDSLSSDCGMYA